MIVDPNSGVSTYDFKVVAPEDEAPGAEAPKLVDFDAWIEERFKDRGLQTADVYRLRHVTSTLASNAIEGAAND